MALPKLNLARLAGGPAMITLGGTSIYTKTGVNLDPEQRFFDIEIDGYSVVDKRRDGAILPVTFTPSGVFNAAQIAALCPLVNMGLGRYVTPVVVVSAIDTTDDELTSVDHGFTAGDSGYIDATTTAPAGTSTSTLYYFGVVDTDTITLHTTRAAAVAGTSKVNITDSGTGTISLIRNNPVVIQSYAGVTLTIHNAAITKQPNLFLSAKKTIFGEATIEGFLRHGYDPDDSAAYYTIAASAWDPATFPTVSDIITQPYEVAWDGKSAPWDNIRTKEGVEISFDATMGDIEVDGLGVVSKQLTKTAAAATMMPTDASEDDLLTALKIQGSGAAPGTSLSTGSAELNISGTNVYVRLYNANLTKGPARWNQADRRAGQISFEATRAQSGGVVDPLLYIGTSAPA